MRKHSMRMGVSQMRVMVLAHNARPTIRLISSRAHCPNKKKLG
jgi:hypothetical protein